MPRSIFNTGDDHQAHPMMARHVSALPDPRVPAFTAVDMRYGWRPDDDFEVPPLLHGETGGDPPPLEYERDSLYIKLEWRH